MFLPERKKAENLANSFQFLGGAFFGVSHELKSSLAKSGEFAARQPEASAVEGGLGTSGSFSSKYEGF